MLNAMYIVQERDDDDAEEPDELEPLARRHCDGEEGASDYDDDAASDASSEALALAVATEETVKEEEEAAKVPSQPRQALTRLGSLLPRRAEPGQEGQSFSCLLDQNDIHIYTAMLRRSLAAGQHLYGDEQPDILTSSENHLVFRSDSILALS